MLIFSPDRVRELNELERSVFDYVLQNVAEVQNFAVRELANRTHVSTATIMRLSAKLGFTGWADFRFYLKDRSVQPSIPVNYHENLLQLDLFLRVLTEKAYSRKMSSAAHLISEARYRVFIGLGTSGALAEYGARYFTNIGLESYAISDPYQAMKGKGAEDVLTIVLSASGETEKIIERLLVLREKGAKVLSITNYENTTISGLSDINLTYNFQEEHSSYDPLENLTSQLPVVAYIEMLAHQALG